LARLNEKNDNESCTLARVVLDERLEALANAEPNGVLAFARGLSAQADWAIEQLGNIEQFDIPAECKKTRMFFCALVVSGWTTGSCVEVQKRCARTLRSWPVAEVDEVSDILRKHLESTAAVINPHHVARMLGDFFEGANLGEGENKVWRTVFKAISRYSDMQDLVILGQAFCILQRAPSAPLRDVIKHSLEHR